MYYIIKNNDGGDTINVVSDPSTGDPLGFYDIMDAVEFSEKHGSTGQSINIVDLGNEKLKAIA